jgi:hypothetical protein
MFETLEKIEKTLYAPSRNFTLKNVVMLASGSRDKKRYKASYTKEFKSQKYSDAVNLESLVLRTSDFLVFSYSAQDTFEEVYVSYPHLVKVINSFKAMNESMKSPDLFIEQEGELYVNSDYADFSIKIGGLSNGKSLMLSPDVIQEENNGEIAGVVMYIGNENCIVEMNHEVFSSFVYFLETFNLQMSSQLLVNFAAMHEISLGHISTTPASSSRSSAPTVKPPKARKIAKPSNNTNVIMDDEEEDEQEEPVRQPIKKPTNGKSSIKKPKEKPIEVDESIDYPFEDVPSKKERTAEDLFDDEEDGDAGSGGGGLLSLGNLTKAMSEDDDNLFDE